MKKFISTPAHERALDRMEKELEAEDPGWEQRLEASMPPYEYSPASDNPEYTAWGNMIRRCYHPQSAKFKRYGGRGITVCDRWKKNFTAFLNDMGKRPSDKHSIDRIDNNGNYEPGNCRWATASMQMQNTSRSKKYRLVSPN